MHSKEIRLRDRDDYLDHIWIVVTVSGGRGRHGRAWHQDNNSLNSRTGRSTEGPFTLEGF